MKWNPESKILEISYQDLEHILGSYPDEDFEEGLASALFLAGLRDIDGNGLEIADIVDILIHFQQRTVWAPGTPPEMLSVHKGRVSDA